MDTKINKRYSQRKTMTRKVAIPRKVTIISRTPEPISYVRNLFLTPNRISTRQKEDPINYVRNLFLPTDDRSLARLKEVVKRLGLSQGA